MPGSSYEDLTRRFLRDVLPHLHLQERRRPNFLKYTTGNNLELDLWDEGRRLAIEVQGPQHYRAVEGMTTKEESESQRARDTFKRQRCAEEGIKLIECNIFTLCMESRFYSWYLDLCAYLAVTPMTRTSFQMRSEVKEIVKQASNLAANSRPARKRQTRRKPGLLPLLRRYL